jgi:flagellar motor switch protein FliN
MSFSASPLVSDPQSGDGWSQAAAAVTAAVQEALPQIPAAEPLELAEPVADPAAVTLPEPAGAAVTGYLGGGIEGKVLLVVGQELVEALKGTPFGALEPAQALKPALETLAEKLGGRLDGDPTATAIEDCLDVLAGGSVVLVPLEGGGSVGALVGVSLTALPAPPAAASGATAASAARSWGIDMLRDVEMEVTCELGRTRMTVRQLLALAPGDVVELDRVAGAPADLLVNGTLLARGEVVVVDESFGLRITEIVTREAT